jgi:hypothetical protein
VHQVKTLIPRQALCHKKPGNFLSPGFMLSQLLGDNRRDWLELAIQFLFEGALFRRDQDGKNG